MAKPFTGLTRKESNMSNHLTVTGNLTKEPELRYTPAGHARLTSSVASSRWVPGKNGEAAKEYTSFFNVIVWGALAEHCAESLQKGDRVTISGRLDQRSYLDEQQNRRSVIEVTADEVAVSLRFRTARIDRPLRQGTVDLEPGALDPGALDPGALEPNDFGAENDSSFSTGPDQTFRTGADTGARAEFGVAAHESEAMDNDDALAPI
jgi:single-strand DNA-binding protein